MLTGYIWYCSSSAKAQYQGMGLTGSQIYLLLIFYRGCQVRNAGRYKTWKWIATTAQKHRHFLQRSRLEQGGDVAIQIKGCPKGGFVGCCFRPHLAIFQLDSVLCYFSYIVHGTMSDHFWPATRYTRYAQLGLFSVQSLSWHGSGRPNTPSEYAF